MNKQELIKEIKDLEYHNARKRQWVDRGLVLELVEQLDEPQPLKLPVVPQFVADWIEKLKQIKNFIPSLAYALNSEVWSENNLPDECIDWLYNANNQELFARAWLDGYEVEKEKQYYVRFKGMESDNFNYLNFIKFQNAWVLSSIKLDKKFRTEHTRKQLEEAGFGWVFDCEGVEVEEV